MSERENEGFLQKNRGRIREAWGSLTEDDIDRARGNLDELIGTIKQKTGEAEDSIRDQFRRWENEQGSNR